MFKADSLRPFLLRSVALPLVVTAGLLLLVLALMLITTTRSLSRITPLQEHNAIMQRMHDQILSIEYTSLKALSQENQLNRTMLLEMQQAIATLARDPALLTVSAHQHLNQALSQLTARGIAPTEALQRCTALLHLALLDEGRAHTSLLAGFRAQAELEMRLAGISLVSTPLAALLILFLLRRRFLLPLRNLSTLLARLAAGNYQPAPEEDLDPVLAPLMANYNHMVLRLSELEAEQTKRRQNLEAEVRIATRDLLAHNRALAQAERLATVGEMAASLAHELRNPLAGIDLALANLRQDLDEPEKAERLDLVRDEIKRLTSLLNSLLDHARQTPEALTPITLAQTLAELLALVRYQIPEDISLHQTVPDDLVCVLPEGRLRQVILNLVLNAAQILSSKGTIRVSATLDSDQLRLIVADDGPGFPEVLLREGVQAFHTGRSGGTGLGLAAVRRLAMDLAGKLILENPPEGGARATLVLPCQNRRKCHERHPAHHRR